MVTDTDQNREYTGRSQQCSGGEAARSKSVLCVSVREAANQ